MENSGHKTIEIPSREQMIFFLVTCAYPGVLARYGSSATAFREELRDQPLQVIIAMYESAIEKQRATVQKRLAKKGIKTIAVSKGGNEF